MTDVVPEDKPPAPIMGLGAGFGDALTSALDVMAFTNDINIVPSSTLFGNKKFYCYFHDHKKKKTVVIIKRALSYTRYTKLM